MKAKINAEECVGCESCVDICKEVAIYMDGGIAIIEFDKCVGDGLCAEECPTEAIIMEEE
jgi:NAD-dependent dihydropyrimidine dehydrogenase PreA subunit